MIPIPDSSMVLNFSHVLIEEAGSFLAGASSKIPPEKLTPNLDEPDDLRLHKNSQITRVWTIVCGSIFRENKPIWMKCCSFVTSFWSGGK